MITLTDNYYDADTTWNYYSDSTTSGDYIIKAEIEVVQCYFCRKKIKYEAKVRVFKGGYSYTMCSDCEAIFALLVTEYKNGRKEAVSRIFRTIDGRRHRLDEMVKKTRKIGTVVKKVLQ